MFGTIPPATRALLLANVAVFLLQQVAGDALITWFALWPLDSGLFRLWQLLTYAFLHGSLAHIFLNMFALFMFGRSLEGYWGGRRFVLFYLVCVLAAALTQLAVQAAGGAAEPVLGASGGVFGVLLAFGWYFPRQRLILLPIPIPMPAWLFVTLYALAELFFGLTGKQPDVAHFAHLGGMLGGALCILY
ncbi:MAG TPA: rhomboid family intramembrane serine protease, partial [Steroidobacteraceae bacterium]